MLLDTRDTINLAGTLRLITRIAESRLDLSRWLRSSPISFFFLSFRDHPPVPVPERLSTRFAFDFTPRSS